MMKILIVDDHAKMRQLVRQALNLAPQAVIESRDGLEALDAYRLHHPDLVIMDIRMPRLDGLAATKRLVAQYPEAKVLMLTDYDDDDLRAAAFQAGARGYALKHDIGELESIVEALP